MSVFKNNICSSSTNIPKDTEYINKKHFDSSNYKAKNENQYANNNNPHRIDYITLQIPRIQHEPGTYIFWTLVVLLFVLALINFVLTFVILGVLRLGETMESLEFVPENSLIKFFGNIDLDNIYKRDGKLESFFNSPMEILGDAGNINIGILETGAEITPLITFGPKLQSLKNIESFDVKHPTTGKSIFSTDFPNFGLPRGVEKLDVQVAQTKRISSAVDEGLLIKSDSFVKIKGSEGVHIDGKEIILSADQDIFLKSVNKSIILNGDNGVFIDVRNIPIASKGKDVRRSHTQYKICICMPDGKLFRLPIPPGASSRVNCNSVDHSQNPCM